MSTTVKDIRDLIEGLDDNEKIGFYDEKENEIIDIDVDLESWSQINPNFPKTKYLYTFRRSEAKYILSLD